MAGALLSADRSPAAYTKYIDWIAYFLKYRDTPKLHFID
jgi:hypothetical protein